MADDLDDLRARVAAARDQLTHDVDDAQKVELRLNDLARIVEGSLARQSAELEAAQGRIAVLDEDLARALARAEQAAGDAAKADHLAKENGELRSMVMTLLEVIEGRQKSSLASVMQKLEEDVSALVVARPQPVAIAEVPVAAAPEETAPADTSPEDASTGDISVEDSSTEALSMENAPADAAAWETPLTESGPEAAPDAPAEEEIELEMEPETEAPAEPEAAKEPAPMEDLSEIALYDASEEVIEPSKP